MATGRRFRGLGKGRKTRRVLERGGAGAAARLNRTLGEWPGVRITPMFGRWGYFAGARLFACFPLRANDSDLWIRLTRADQARALGETGVRITPMFGRWGYFAGARLFACFPLRAKDSDLWIRLTRADQARALGESGVRPHRRFASRGWIELDVRTETDVAQALRWLRRARGASDTGGDDAG